MKAIKIALKLDTFVQGIVLLFVIGALIAFAKDEAYSGLAWKGFIALGIVQILSAIGLGIALHDSRRGDHLGYSLGYFLGFILLVPLMAGFVSITDLSSVTIFLGGLYMFGIPAFLAIRYFYMTVRDMIRVKTMRRSFWDI